VLAASASGVMTLDKILDALRGPKAVAESNVGNRYIQSLEAELQNVWWKPRAIIDVSG
jgi:hypothetical protein